MKLKVIAFAVSLFAVSFASVAQEPKASTAQPTVSVLATQLDMPGLNRKRQLRIYLPPGYATSNKRYPVLYMHDGQNLFDNASAYAGEWNVDETMNALAKEGKLELIVVGVDNGQDKRMTELNPWSHEKIGKGEGREYMDFVVKTVKPLIDSSYRTLSDRANTAVMGSSMGGLISHYAINQYPDVFSKAGVFSPAYWPTGGEMFKFAATTKAKSDARLYLLMGEKEGQGMVRDVRRMHMELKKAGHPDANQWLKVVPGAEHNEAFWSREFREAVMWMFEKS